MLKIQHNFNKIDFNTNTKSFLLCGNTDNYMRVTVLTKGIIDEKQEI